MKTGGNKAYFKKNLFGGFNREDVIAYLAEQAREQAKETEALSQNAAKSAAEAEKLSQENARLSKSVASANEQIYTMAARLREVTAAKTIAEERLSALQADLEAAASSLAAGDSTSVADVQVDELLRRIEALSAQNAEMAARLTRLSRFRESVQGLLESAAPIPPAETEETDHGE